MAAWPRTATPSSRLGVWTWTATPGRLVPQARRLRHRIVESLQSLGRSSCASARVVELARSALRAVEDELAVSGEVAAPPIVVGRCPDTPALLALQDHSTGFAAHARFIAPTPSTAAPRQLLRPGRRQKKPQRKRNRVGTAARARSLATLDNPFEYPRRTSSSPTRRRPKECHTSSSDTSAAPRGGIRAYAAFSCGWFLRSGDSRAATPTLRKECACAHADRFRNGFPCRGCLDRGQVGPLHHQGRPRPLAAADSRHRFGGQREPALPVAMRANPPSVQDGARRRGVLRRRGCIHVVVVRMR